MEVLTSSESLNQLDVFLLFVKPVGSDVKVFKWAGQHASLYKKQAALEATRHIANWHSGRGTKQPHCKLVLIEEANDDNLAQFWETLGDPGQTGIIAAGRHSGSGSPRGTKSNKVTRKESDKIRIWHIEDSPALKLSKCKPPKKESHGLLVRDLLDDTGAFIIDTGSYVFVWVGTTASKMLSKFALVRARDFLAESNRTVPVEKFVAQQETSVFKSLFHQFVTENALAEERMWVDQQKELTNTPNHIIALASQMAQPIKVFRAQDGQEIVVPSNSWGQFFSLSCYFIIQYEKSDEGLASAAYDGSNIEERTVENAFLWIGQQCLCGGSSARKQVDQAWLMGLQMLKSLNELATNATFWRVLEGEEPQSFKALFPGGISVHSGEDPWHTLSEKHTLTAMKANITESLAQSKCADVGAGKLYRVLSTRTKTTVLVQCVASAKYLNSGECFVVEDANVLYIWQGGGATEKDKFLASQAPDILDKKVSETDISIACLPHSPEVLYSHAGIPAWASKWRHPACFGG